LSSLQELFRILNDGVYQDLMNGLALMSQVLIFSSELKPEMDYKHPRLIMFINFVHVVNFGGKTTDFNISISRYSTAMTLTRTPLESSFGAGRKKSCASLTSDPSV
jgi:hypothetical protein